jgi:uncharacterized protein YbjT (DUF2867 family)
MIVVPGTLDPPAGRLLATLAARGQESLVRPAALPPGDAPVTIAVSSGAFVFDFAGLVASLAGRPFRVLILSRLGAHPDAKAPGLRRLWRLEEHVRGGGAPTLTLRFAPLLGPRSPLWNRLRTRPRLPGRGRQLLNPALEADAVETLVRALADPAPWSGWFEVAGPEAWSLLELRTLAAESGPGPDAGDWEPPPSELAEHRLAESGPWSERFALTPAPLAAALRGRAA